MSNTESNLGYDSTSSADVQAAHPAAGSVIFGYANGAFAWTPEDWAKFPDDRHCVIVEYIPGESIVNVEGDILDVEAQYLAPGSPNGPEARSQAAQWAAGRRRAGKIPGLYSSLDYVHDLVVVMGEPTAIFIADWTGEEHQAQIPNEEDVIATQYASPSKPAPGEGHWDLSEIDNERFDAWYEHNHPGTGSGGSTPAPGPDPGQSTGGTFDVQLPTLSEKNPGQDVVNEHVRALQALLNLRVGAQLTTDGRYGSHTAGAVVSLEHAHGLTVDAGIAGPQVWGALLGS